MPKAGMIGERRNEDWGETQAIRPASVATRGVRSAAGLVTARLPSGLRPSAVQSSS